MYKLCPNKENGSASTSVKRLSDCAYIPFDESNTSYQEYLQWLAQGNEPLPADEQETP